jgi:hypothetical protein
MKVGAEGGNKWVDKGIFGNKDFFLGVFTERSFVQSVVVVVAATAAAVAVALRCCSRAKREDRK